MRGVRFTKVRDEREMHDPTDVIVTCNSPNINDICEAFEGFLVAAGFPYAVQHLKEYWEEVE